MISQYFTDDVDNYREPVTPPKAALLAAMKLNANAYWRDDAGESRKQEPPLANVTQDESLGYARKECDL